MKLVTSKLPDLGRAIPGAEDTARDATIIVPAMVQPVVELPSPLKTFQNNPPNAVISDSFNFNSTIQIAGAGGGSVVTSPALERGVWRLSGFFRDQFTGVTVFSNADQLTLQDPAGGAIVLATASHFTLLSCFLPINLLISITLPGCTLQLASNVTAVGDLSVVGCDIVASRIL